jgi:phage baseplate assembly protein W
MAERSFKSVGELNVDVRAAQTRQPVPVGIVTPVVYSSKVGGPLEMSTSIVNQVIDNFRNMLLTNHGERVPLFDYGANLRQLLTERLAIDDYESQAMLLIKATTEKYMPYVNLDTFEVQTMQTDTESLSKVKVLVKFSIPRLTTSSKLLEIILTNIG